MRSHAQSVVPTGDGLPCSSGPVLMITTPWPRRVTCHTPTKAFKPPPQTRGWWQSVRGTHHVYCAAPIWQTPPPLFGRGQTKYYTPPPPPSPAPKRNLVFQVIVHSTSIDVSHHCKAPEKVPNCGLCETHHAFKAPHGGAIKHAFSVGFAKMALLTD